jgi:hypothetical protein
MAKPSTPQPNLRSIEGSGRKQATKRTSFVVPTAWDEYLTTVANQQRSTRTQVILEALALHKAERSPVSLFDTEDTDDFYDPLKFYTASQDTHGHSLQLRVTFPKPVVGEMAALVERRDVPAYMSKEMIIRDAVYHRLKIIARALDDGELESVVNVAMIHAEEVMMADLDEQAEQVVSAVNANVQRLNGQKQWEALRVYLAEREELAESLPEPHRGELIRVVKAARGMMR